MAKRKDSTVEGTDERTAGLRPPWQPGQSGNPEGMKPGLTNYRYQFNRLMLDASLELAEDGRTKAHHILSNVVDGAVEGKQTALRLWMEQAYQGDWISEIEEFETRGEKRDRDFLHYRLARSGSDVQQGILFTRKKYLALMAGRRGGKSEALRLWFADEFVTDPAARCLYIGLTLTTAMNLLWQPMMDMFELLGIRVTGHSRVDGSITTEAGGVMKFGGNSTKEEREKNRGPWWDRIALDEVQSQKDVRYLVESILSPTLIDKQGQIALAGTGPRVRGTYWEAFYLGAWADGSPMYPDAFRANWNLTDNPFIKGHDRLLEEIRKEKNLTESDPLYVREYLGRIAYDDDALVLRLGEQNSFDDAALAAWIASQPVTDVRFAGGLDFGFEDADAFAVIAYSVSKAERFIVYEWKGNRIGTAELAAEIRKGIEYVKTSPIFKGVAHDFDIHADTGGNAITPYDLATQYSLPIQAAYKQEKDMAVELLQDEARRGILKVRRGGVIWEESLRTVYARNEQDQLTREIDDESYHPDAIMALLYGMRPIWLFNTRGEA